MDWVKVKLEEIAEEKRDNYEPNSEEQLNYIGLEHIEQQTLRLNGIGKSNETISSKKKFNSGDILFGSLRPYFRKVYKPDFNGVCSTDITVIRSKQNFLQDYLFYLVANQPFIDCATNFSNGTRMPRANWKVISKSEWKVPKNKNDQQKIASILSSYDDLIENNIRRIKILEKMAQTIYKEWFVNFRFPGYEKVKYVVSPSGRIPEGWQVCMLGDIIKFKNGKAIIPEGVGEFPVYGSNGIIGSTNEPIFSNGVIIGRVGAYCGSIQYCKSKYWASDNTIVAEETEDKKLSIGVILHLLKLFNLRKYAGGAAQPLLTQSTIRVLKTILPNKNINTLYSNIYNVIIDQIINFKTKNQNLRKTRDLLLPKLMGGEIEV